jgi:glucose-6-phosphate isomerase
MSSVTQTPAWKALEEHHKKTKDVQIKDLFAQDPDRFKKFNASFKDIPF